MKDPWSAITPVDVFAAAKRLEGITTRTPMRRSEKLSAIAGGDVWFKLECLQITGSFKARGAYNALVQLTPAERGRGIVAASAGNHGLGIAWSARALGLKATIFVPRDAPGKKRDGIVALGAVVDDASAGYDEAHARAMEFAHRGGATCVEACSTAPVLAGQGTVALEIVQELPAVATVLVPFGGGGLAGGVGDFLRAVAPEVRIVGVQTERADAIARSLDAGHVVPIEDQPTLADGLAGQADAGGLAIARRVLDDIVVVSEDELGDTMAFLVREEGLTAEGAGAVGAAAILHRKRPSLRPPIVLVVSGGNVDEIRVASLLERYRPNF